MGALVAWGAGRPTSARPVSATSETSLDVGVSGGAFPDQMEAIVYSRSGCRSIVNHYHGDQSMLYKEVVAAMLCRGWQGR